MRYVSINKIYYKLKAKTHKQCKNCELSKHRKKDKCLYELVTEKDENIARGAICYYYGDNELIEITDKKELLLCKTNNEIKKFKTIINERETWNI